MNKYETIAAELIEAVGKDNIISAAHCATRLRLVVKDKEAIDQKKVEATDEVKGVFFTAGQYQIILGTGIVNKVFAEAEKMGLPTVSKDAQKQDLKQSEKGMKKYMTTLADIFVPIIPVIAATGLFLGLKGCLFNDNILALFGMSSSMIPEYIVTLTTVLTDTAFAFLPSLIVWSSFKVFGGTPIIGMVIGLMMVSPALPNAYSVADPASGVSAIMAFGSIPLVGCQGSVLTAIAAGWIGSTVEKYFRKHMPNVFDLIMTPFFTMLITLLVILLVVGPIMHNIELGMVNIIEVLIHLPFGIGGFLIGFTYPLAVITGLHHSYVMIETSLLANTGFNALITLCGMYGFANVGTCLAFMARSRQSRIRQTAAGAMASQLFGISEPVLFGLQLRWNLKPLLIMCFSSGVGALLLSLFSIQSNSYGLAVLPSYLMYIYEPYQLLVYFLVSAGTLALCFTLTCAFGMPREVLQADAASSDNKSGSTQAKAIVSDQNQKDSSFGEVAAGTVMALCKTADPVFSSKAMGDGYAILPADGVIKAPVDGVLETVFPGGHCYGIVSGEHEILIHCGIDTVNLQGEGFDVKVRQGQSVRQGDVLCIMDLELLKRKQIDPTVFVVFPKAVPETVVTSGLMLQEAAA